TLMRGSRRVVRFCSQQWGPPHRAAGPAAATAALDSLLDHPAGCDPLASIDSIREMPFPAGTALSGAHRSPTLLEGAPMARLTWALALRAVSLGLAIAASPAPGSSIRALAAVEQFGFNPGGISGADSVTTASVEGTSFFDIHSDFFLANRIATDHSPF